MDIESATGRLMTQRRYVRGLRAYAARCRRQYDDWRMLDVWASRQPERRTLVAYDELLDTLEELRDAEIELCAVEWAAQAERYED